MFNPLHDRRVAPSENFDEKRRVDPAQSRIGQVLKRLNRRFPVSGQLNAVAVGGVFLIPGDGIRNRIRSKTENGYERAITAGGRPDLQAPLYEAFGRRIWTAAYKACQ